MGDKWIMSKKELERKTIIEAVESGRLQLTDAAVRMKVSYRQAKRIWRRYREEKDAGLCHRGRGRSPNNAYTKAVKEGILERYQERYAQFGPTFAAEKLAEDDGLTVNAETLRLWLKAAGLWQRKRKHHVYRERRERRPAFGELLQIDGSIHRWFEAEDRHYCLLNMVDDATGICLALLDTGETTQVLLMTFLKWIQLYGVPKAVYVDLKNIYVTVRKLKEKYDDDLLLQKDFSVFEQVCQKLGVQIIRAYSPQAKGRVERKHAVFQDRFVKELKLYDIHTLDAANVHLESFLKSINKKFAKPLESVPNAHRDATPYGDLQQILCWNYRRQVRQDWTIQFKREYYQIAKGYEQILKPEAFVVLRRYLDGTMRFWYESTELLYEKLTCKPEPPSRSKNYYALKKPAKPKPLTKPSQGNPHRHPWRQLNPDGLKS